MNSNMICVMQIMLPSYTRQRPFQRNHEHKQSAIGKHRRVAHNHRNNDIQEQFTILKKCRGKFECLIYEMLFIQKKKPKLSTQSESIKVKLFSTYLTPFVLHIFRLYAIRFLHAFSI